MYSIKLLYVEYKLTDTMNKIIITRLIPDGFVMNICNIFLTRDKNYIDKYVVNHELIHTAQMREMAYLFFI